MRLRFVIEFSGLVDVRWLGSESGLIKRPDLHADSLRFIRWGRNESFSFRLAMELYLRAIESALAKYSRIAF